MRLSEAISAYVQHKRVDGLSFLAPGDDLVSFCKHVGDLPLDKVTSEHVLRYLDGARTVNTKRRKHSLLQRFFDYWSRRRQMPHLVLPAPPPSEHRTFTPFVFSRSEIHLLLEETAICQKRRNCLIDAHTLRMLVLTLYATGALCGEILSLRRRDIAFKESRIKIHRTNPARSRCIPIQRDLRNELKAFLWLRHRIRIDDKPIFLTTAGEPITVACLDHTFRRLRRLAGITRTDNSNYQPRLHDLRTTFAVHRISSWIRAGIDLDRMLPALAVYMGNVWLGSTEKYLAMTPERFRKQLQMVSPQRGRKKWRNDPELMRFLDSL